MDKIILDWNSIKPDGEGDIVEWYLDAWSQDILYVTTQKHCYIVTNIGNDKPNVVRHTSDIRLDGN